MNCSSSYSPILSSAHSRCAYVILSAFMAMITIVGTTANIMALVKISRTKKKILLTGILANICVSDLLSAFFGGGISAITSWNESFIFGYWSCVFSGYVVALGGISSLMSITFIAVERFYIICRHNRINCVGPGNLKWAILLAWVWSIFWNTPVLFIKNGYATEGLGTTCAPNYRLKHPLGLAWNYIYFVACFLAPLIVIVYFYAQIVVHVQKSRKIPGDLKSANIKSIKRNMRATIMSAVMVGAFLTAWSPYATISVMTTYFGITTGATFETIAVVCAKSSTIYNPVIYIQMNKQIGNERSRNIRMATMTVSSQ